MFSPSQNLLQEDDLNRIRDETDNSIATQNDWQPSEQFESLRDLAKYDQNAELVIYPTRKTSTLTILLLMSSATLPLVMGILFFISLGLNAPDGHFSNGTFVRPTHQGLSLGTFGSNSTHSIHLSPLLISSISSTLIGSISAVVMSLLALHLGSRWILLSKEQRAHLPTPYQFYLVHSLTSEATAIAMLRFLAYAFLRSTSRNEDGDAAGCTGDDTQLRTSSTNKPFPHCVSCKRRARISPNLLLAAMGLTTTLFFSLAIKGLDVWLHKDIKSEIVPVTLAESDPFYGAASLDTSCHSNTHPSCPVLNRSVAASCGGQNKSSDFAIYNAPVSVVDVAGLPDGRLSFIGPAQPPLNAMSEAQTYAISTTCETYRPICNVDQATEVVNDCGSHDLPVDVSFSTSTWGNRVQVFLSTGTPGAKWLELSTDRNPLNIVGFACFNDNSNIQYDDRNRSFHTPFVNWWMIGAGIRNRPYILCFILSCNSTIYDAKYSLALGGSPILLTNNDSMHHSNASLAMLMSAPLTFLSGQPINSSAYQYSQRFLDDQLQVDFLAAGNTYGNDTKAFSGAVAQSLSNRLLGWSAGAIRMTPVPATRVENQVGISLHLTPAFIYVILHLLYAGLVVVLGLSCFTIPSQHRTGYIYKVPGNTPSATTVTVPSEVELAQMKLSTASTLVQEMVMRTGYGREDVGFSTSIRSGDIKLNRPVCPGFKPRDISKLEDREGNTNALVSERKDIRMALRKDSNGYLWMEML